MGIGIIGTAGGGGAKQVIRRITSTQTWTAPADVSAVEVFLVGGGGSGGPAIGAYYGNNLHAAGGGGAGGQIIEDTISVTPGQTYTITVGAGGSGLTNAQGNNTESLGSVGGTSSFGNILSAKGGGFGTAGMYYGAISYDYYNYQAVPAARHFFQDAWGRGGLGMTNVGINSNNFYDAALPGPGAMSSARLQASHTTQTTGNYTVLSSEGLGIAHFNGGFASVPYSGGTSSWMWAPIIAGRGKNGYGGGGGGAAFAFSTNGSPQNNSYDISAGMLYYPQTLGVDGGGNARWEFGAGGSQGYLNDTNSGAANKGGGGGGSTCARSRYQTNAGNGGSGVCIIKYTTALEA